MKKIIGLLLVIILLLAGCSKPVDNIAQTPRADVPNPNGYMEEPQILVSSAHRYNQESWLDEEKELESDSIALQGDSFFATIIFQGSVSEEKLKKAIILEGFKLTPEINITPSEGKTVFYAGYRNLEPNKSYKLIISKNLADSEGKTLESDIQKEIMLKPDTTASYTFFGCDGVYKELGVNTIIDAYAVGSMNLTPEPKDFLVEFSAEVNKESVEKSIKDGFTDKDIKISFNWKNAKSLGIGLSGFKSGEDKPYNISMDGAKDINGSRVYGNLFFAVGSANELGVIDIASKSDSVLKRFEGKRFMAVQSGVVDRTVLLDDTESKFVYDMLSGRIRRIDADDAGGRYTKGVPGLNFICTWLGSDKLVLLDKDTGKLLNYSTTQGTSKELFQLPKDISKDDILEISVSPDKSKLVVIHQTIDPQAYGFSVDGFHISILDMTGNILQKHDDVFRPRAMEIFGYVSDIQWLDNETLILEDNISTENKLDYNVVSININTGKKTLIAEHAFKPAVLTDKDIIKVESFTDLETGERSIDIIKSEKKIRSFKAESFQYDNFFFSDENTIVYNESEKIFVYYINKAKSEQLGSGYITGLSEDGSKIYYVTNHKMLYYID